MDPSLKGPFFMLQSMLSQQRRGMLIVLSAGILIMVLKFVAYFYTHSNAILTDALESIINVVAGFFALYSIQLAAKPKDPEHPYGHGKIEFISAGFEGGLILITAIVIIIKSIDNLIHPIDIHALDIGIWISVVTGALNFVLGTYIIHIGKNSKSITLTADGKHLLTDTYTSLGIVAGLVIITLTELIWLDAVIAILFGLIILRTGYQLVRKSLSGLMDEADTTTLNEVVTLLNTYRQPQWIDIHNLRVLRYGSFLHIDCHITLPWYNDLKSSHDEIKQIEEIISKEFQNRVEIFIHADPCIPDSCSICNLDACGKRVHPFRQQIPWELSRLLNDQKHRIANA